MITNERQYRITKAEIARFEAALAHAWEDAADLSPRLRQAMRDQFASQLEDLRAEVEEYEALRGGRVAVLEIESLGELPEVLIRARAAAGLSQRDLARKLGLQEQQIQRYEAQRYAGASFERLQAVADALGVMTHGRVVMPVPAPSALPPQSVVEPAGADVRPVTPVQAGEIVAAAREAPVDPTGRTSERPGDRDAAPSYGLSGALVRSGVTLHALAERLEVPNGFALMLQRGEVEPTTVPEEMVTEIGTVLGTDRDRTLALIDGGRVPTLAHAARGQRERAAGRGGSAARLPAAPPAARPRLPFREALRRCPDLTTSQRRRWLGDEPGGRGGRRGPARATQRPNGGSRAGSAGPSNTPKAGRAAKRR